MTRYDFLWARWVILHDSFSDCFKIWHRGAVLLEEYYICWVNMAYMYGQIRAIKGKYNQIGANKG